jgi:hypothetical protein
MANYDHPTPAPAEPGPLSSPDPFPPVTRTITVDDEISTTYPEPYWLLNKVLHNHEKKLDVPGDGAAEVVRSYAQRIWDITASCWVYYTQTAINATPLAADTVPTHSGTLRAGSHEVLFVTEQD